MPPLINPLAGSLTTQNPALIKAGKAFSFNQRFNQNFNRQFNQKFDQKQDALAQKISQPKLPKPPKPAAAAQPAQPAQPGSAGPGGASGTAGSPYDATYYNNVAANNFKVNNQINALNLQGANAGTSLQATLAQLAYQQPRADLALEQKFNANGGLYSSAEGQGIGNLNYQYLGREGAATNRYSDTMAAIASKIGALQGSEPIYDNGQALASAARQSNLAQKLPAPGLSPGGLTPQQYNQLYNQRFNQRFAQKLAAKKGRR